MTQLPTALCRIALLACGVVLLFGLAGCATPPAATTTAGWSGRLSLHVESTPPQSFSAAFDLQGSADHGSITFFSPFGQTLAKAAWQPGLATLEQEQQHLHYPDMAALTTALTGTPLPLPALFDWIRGMASDTPGWTVDLSQQPHGRLQARRLDPLPAATLRLILK